MANERLTAAETGFLISHALPDSRRYYLICMVLSIVGLTSSVLIGVASLAVGWLMARCNGCAMEAVVGFVSLAGRIVVG